MGTTVRRPMRFLAAVLSLLVLGVTAGAAGAAVPESRALLVDSVKQMSFDDARQVSRFGVIDPRDARVEDYVTRKAPDGLFLMIAEEERAIRKDPLGQTSKLSQRVFGAARR